MDWAGNADRNPPWFRVDEPPVSLIVVNYGNQHLAGNLLRSLAAHQDRALIREAVVVDNGFPEMGDSRALLSAARFPFPLRFVQYPGHSYSGSINLAEQGCRGAVLLLSNNDVEWLPGFSIAPVVREIVSHPDVGIAGPQLVFPDGRWQRSAGTFPSLREGLATLFFLGVLRNRLAAARHSLVGGELPVQDVDFVDGACLAVSRECFEELGGWDTTFEFYACEAEFCWRAKMGGWRRVLVPTARVMHVRGASSSGSRKRVYVRRLFAAKRRMVERMHGRIHAAGYDILQRAAAIEYAFVFGLLDALWPTPGSTRRATAAREAGLAAIGARKSDSAARHAA